jgi:hypothetical protein
MGDMMIYLLIPTAGSAAPYCSTGTENPRRRPGTFFQRELCSQERDDDDQDHYTLLANHRLEKCGELQHPQTSPANIDAAVWVDRLDPASNSPFGDYYN